MIKLRLHGLKCCLDFQVQGLAVLGLWQRIHTLEVNLLASKKSLAALLKAAQHKFVAELSVLRASPCACRLSRQRRLFYPGCYEACSATAAHVMLGLVFHGVPANESRPIHAQEMCRLCASRGFEPVLHRVASGVYTEIYNQ